MKNLDKFEQDILNSVENGEWQSKNNTENRLKELQSYIKNLHSKNKMQKCNLCKKYKGHLKKIK